MAGAVLAVAPAGATAQNAPPPACMSDDYRAFDFWVGEWSVSDTSGTQVGTNVIRRIAGRCGLLENWIDGGGGTGKSMNWFDRRDGQWHQQWIGSTGLLLHLVGGIDHGRMVLAGDRVTANGTTVRDRITWTPEGGDVVRQVWDISTDGGTTWRTVFNGLYRKTGDATR